MQVDVGIQLAIIFFYILTMTTILWMYYHHANEITFYVSQFRSFISKLTYINYRAIN